MKLKNFMKLYTGNASITIDGYCDEERYDYYLLPPKEVEDFSGDNQNRYIPPCLELESWWDEVKDLQVDIFSILNGRHGGRELYIKLKGSKKHAEIE